MNEQDVEIAKIKEKQEGMSKDITKLYVITENSDKNISTLSITMAEVNANIKNMDKTMDILASELKAGRLEEVKRISDQDKKINELQDKDGKNAQGILLWLGKNIGGFILGIIGAAVAMYLKINK